MQEKMISIVIPTFNNERTIEACLRSIRDQDYPELELIVVDNFSTDRTMEIAAPYADRIIQVRGTPPNSRNAGFKISHGATLVSIDSDMILREGIISEIARRIKDFDALILPETGVGSDFISRCKDLEKRCYIGDEVIESARAFRRDVFFAVSGYDPDLIFGEDWDLNARLKERFSVGRIETCLMHDVRHTSMAKDLKKAYRYGRSLDRYLKKKHPQAGRWLDPKRFFFIRNAGKLAREPLEGAGLAVIKGAEYAAGLAGYVSSRIARFGSDRPK